MICINKSENVLREGPCLLFISAPCLQQRHTHTFTCTLMYSDIHTYTQTYKYAHTCTHMCTYIYTILPLNCSMALGDRMRHNVDTTATVNELLDRNYIKRFR